ncbi:hypothetical protein B0H14DRAFT_3479417 [Mycena olivaceomarginata]|nr:hypothetical protein B0H14DRAFT_3479417 [Mycena olivaceomarginata]
MSAESYIHANHARHDQGSGPSTRSPLPTLRIASAAILIGTSHLPLPSNAPRPRPYCPTLDQKHPKLGLKAGCFASLGCAWRQRHPHVFYIAVGRRLRSRARVHPLDVVCLLRRPPKHPVRPHPLPPPPSTRRLTGLSDDVQVTPYLHRQRLRFVLALGGLSDPAWGAAPEKLACLLNNAAKTLGLDVYAPHVLSVHRLGAIVEAKRILGDLVQVVYVEMAAAERIRRQVERELRDKDAVKRERGAECVKGIADLVLDNSGGLEKAWAELEGLLW